MEPKNEDKKMPPKLGNLGKEGPLVEIKVPQFSPAKISRESLHHKLSPRRLIKKLNIEPKKIERQAEEPNQNLNKNFKFDSKNKPKMSNFLVMSEMRVWGEIIATIETMKSSNSIKDEDCSIADVFHLLSLIKIGRIKEADSILDSLEISSKSGSIFFAFEMIRLQLGRTTGKIKANEAIESIGQVISKLVLIKSKINVEGYEEVSLNTAVLWKRRFHMYLAGIFVAEGRWRNVISELNELDVELRNCLKNHLPKISQQEDHSYEISLYLSLGQINSHIGKVFLNIGDVEKAEIFFSRAESFWGHKKIKFSISKAQIWINRGLIAFAKGDYTNSSAFSERAANEARLGHNDVARLDLGIDFDGASTVISNSINNAALSYLYKCDIEKALSLLENVLLENPIGSLRDPTAFNLCALYDLSRGPGESTQMKSSLEELTKKLPLQDISKSSFRLKEPQ